MRGFTVCCYGDAVDVRVATAQDRPARSLVSVARDRASQTLGALLGRLDYRNDLKRFLPEHQSPTSLSDAALALAVYLQTGKDGLETLEGEFALVVWDGRERRLLGMRDPLGSWPLYWAWRGSWLALSTELSALAEGEAASSLDQEYVAEFFATPFLDAEVPSTRTCLPTVHRVLPGTMVELTADRQPRPYRYWTWSERITPVVECNRLEEAAERFGQLLDRAVQERLRDDRVATHLSGGMDSSAVTMLARRAVAEKSGQAPIATISLTYEAAELAPERTYVDLVLAQGGLADPHFLPGDAALGFDWFGQPLPPHDEPYVGLWGLAANRQLAEAAEQCGAETVLTGAGGDEILSYRPLHIADLLRRGRWFSGWREAAIWAEAQGQGVWSVLRKCGLEPVWPALSWPLRRWSFAPRAGFGRRSIAPWISPDFVRQQQLADRIDAYSRDRFAPPAAWTETLLRLAMSSGDWARWYLYAPCGISISHPFLDPRVVCYVLGLPRHLRAVPGEPKPLLAAATRGLLPEALRQRREKTGFDGPRARGIARHWPQLQALVKTSPLGELGLFDPQKLLGALQQMALGMGSAHNQWMDRTLALLAWSQQRARHTAELAQAWTSSEARSCA